jgi:predicted molibdopterin-dependent oxidoreductase YjgC
LAASVRRFLGAGAARKATMAGLFQRAIDRGGAAVAFTIDGEPVEAQQGDLLITAILLHRGALRRFEFGPESRAGFCLMGACQDCWVWLADGSRVRACTTVVADGMNVLTSPPRGFGA